MGINTNESMLRHARSVLRTCPTKMVPKGRCGCCEPYEEPPQQAKSAVDSVVSCRSSFVAKAVHALRRHRWCGDCYPDNGWDDVNQALAAYALLKRKGN